MDNFERIRSLKEYIKCLEKMVSEDIDLKIKQGLNLIFKKYNIKNKDDLDNWCGIEGRKKLLSKELDLNSVALRLLRVYSLMMKNGKQTS